MALFFELVWNSLVDRLYDYTLKAGGEVRYLMTGQYCVTFIICLKYIFIRAS